MAAEDSTTGAQPGDTVSANEIQQTLDRQKLEADARLGSRKAQEELGWKDGSSDAEESAPATGQDVLDAQAAADAAAQKAAEDKAAEDKAAEDKKAADEKAAADKAAAAAAAKQQGQQQK